MTDREYKAARKRIQRLIKRWHDILGLRWWKVDYNYVVLDFKANGELSPDTAAVAHVAWEYKEAAISWNVPRCAELSDDELEYVVVHEIMHVFLNETRATDDDWLKHEERVATELARAFLWVRAG